LATAKNCAGVRKILIVGAGFTGAVIARQLARTGNSQVLVIDQRGHVAGNCHTERDAGTGIMVHRYGPHIFHTDRTDVWDYVRQFSDFGPYINRVKASIPRGVYGLPINLLTINQFFGKRFSPAEARAFIASLGDPSIGEPANFEEQALKMLGRDLYEAFFYGYTKKQWGCEPRELPASLLKRLPIRFNYNDSYYNSRFQGIPMDGYTGLIMRMLDHPGIQVKLDTAWEPAMAGDFRHVVFSGPIDQFYSHKYGRLGYRTVYWSQTEHAGDFQGNAVINYPGLEEPFTRIHEHKHFAPWEEHQRTLVFTEFSAETSAGDVPYYPKRLAPDKGLLARYLEDARRETHVSFLGRLATYRYMDMDQVVGEALDFAPMLARALNDNQPPPVFSSQSQLEQ
jgi:UDP-galactopyranose mutase